MPGGEINEERRPERLHIRQADRADSRGISSVVVRALRETNAREYAPEIIEAAVLSFSAGIAGRMTNRLVLVATLADEIIRTASLHQVRCETWASGRSEAK
jgi:hypothetical protein